jgi:DnaK suppressor protein
MNYKRTVLQIEKLEAEREQTLMRLARLQGTLRSEVECDPEEGDPDLAEQEKALALVQGLERKLASIDLALRQAQQGTYGICERCGERIDPARLELVPETTLCIECKTIAEWGMRKKAVPVQI